MSERWLPVSRRCQECERINSLAYKRRRAALKDAA